MSALVFAYYLEKAAKTHTTLQRLLQRVAECINANEAQNEEILEYENEQLIIHSTDMELIENQFDELVAQQSEAEVAVRQCHEMSWRMYEQLKQISWNKIVGFEVQKLNWQYYQEMHETKQKNSKKWLMYQRMEHRNIVQQLRQEQSEYVKVQAELESAQNTPKSYLQMVLRKLSTLETGRNQKIVNLIKFGKQIEQLKTELEKVKQSASVCKELETKKQVLSQKLQQMQLQRPLSATLPEMKAMEQEHLDLFPTRNLFDAFEVELKLPSLADYFNEWETKWQLERQRALLREEVQVNTTAAVPDSAQPLRSILRRPSTDSQGSPAAKSHKSVRFILPDAGDVEVENAPESPPTTNYSELLIDNTDERQEDEVPAECITVLSQTPSTSKQALEDITLLDSDEEEDENAAEDDESIAEDVVEDEFGAYSSAENNNENEIELGDDVRSMEDTFAADKQTDKPHAVNTNKPKIEILECRIIKSADSALPKAAHLPVDLTHESQPIATPNAATNTENLNSTKQTFRKPISKPKSRKVENSDQFFEQLLQYSCENSSSDNWELSAAFEAIERNAKDPPPPQHADSHAESAADLNETNFMDMNDEPESADEQSPMEFKNLLAGNYEQDLSDLSDNGSQTINFNFL